MTKQEFIQEAALRLISARPDALMCEIHELAVNLANCVYEDKSAVPSDQATPDHTVPDINEESIQILLKEVGRVEDEFVKIEMQRRRYAQRGGIDVRLNNVFHGAGVNTVGDLLRMGSRNFLKMRDVGPKCLKFVSEALKNLYGIESW